MAAILYDGHPNPILSGPDSAVGSPGILEALVTAGVTNCRVDLGQQIRVGIAG